MQHRAIGQLNVPLRGFTAPEQGAGIGGLRRQHVQPALRRDTPLPGAEHQLAAQRVIDHVHHALQTGKAVQLHRAAAQIGVHAAGRRVDDAGGVPVLLLRLSVGNSAVSAAAGDAVHLRRAQLRCRRPRRFGCAAGAQHQHLFAGQHQTHAAYQRQHAGKIRVVAVQLAVPVHHGVHRADGPHRIGQLVQIGDDPLLIGDRHVDARKIAPGKKRLQLLRLQRPEAVVIVRQRAVYLGRVAVPQRVADQSADHGRAPFAR